MNELYNAFSSLPPKEYTTLAFILGLLLTDGLNPIEQRSLGGFFVLLGETIWVNATQTEVIDQKLYNAEIIKLKNEMDLLKKRNNLY